MSLGTVRVDRTPARGAQSTAVVVVDGADVEVGAGSEPDVAAPGRLEVVDLGRVVDEPGSVVAVVEALVDGVGASVVDGGSVTGSVVVVDGSVVVGSVVSVVVGGSVVGGYTTTWPPGGTYTRVPGAGRTAR
jgi:hypothetical protein